MDRRAGFVGTRSYGDPVADRGMLVAMAQLAGELGAELAVLRVDDVFASVLHGHARGREAVVLEGTERIGERRVPAQGLKVQGDLLQKVGFRGLALGAHGGAGKNSHMCSTSLRRRKPWRRIHAGQEKVTSGFAISAAPCLHAAS